MTFLLDAVPHAVKPFLLFLTLSCCAVTSFATVSVRSSKKDTVDVAITNESLSTAVAALQPFLSRDVDLLLAGDPIVTYRATRTAPETALRGIVTAARVKLIDEQGRLWIRDTTEPAVTLDVKDADVRSILASMQKQCRIKNLMIDPDVKGTGTFLFHDVPCATAFRVVLRSLGLSSTSYPNVMAVSGRTR